MRRRGDVHNVWLCLRQHSIEVHIPVRDAKTNSSLVREVRLTVADRDDGSARDFRDLLEVRIRDLAASYNGDA
jgi:hypothetical protein